MFQTVQSLEFHIFGLCVANGVCRYNNPLCDLRKHLQCLARVLYCDGVLRVIVCVCVIVHTFSSCAPCLCTSTSPKNYLDVVYVRILDNFNIIVWAAYCQFNNHFTRTRSIINRYFHVVYLSRGSNWYSHQLVYSHLCLHTYYLQWGFIESSSWRNYYLQLQRGGGNGVQSHDDCEHVFAFTRRLVRLGLSCIDILLLLLLLCVHVTGGIIM